MSEIETNTAEYPPLHEAARQGDFNKVKRLISEGVYINYGDDNGRTAFFHALAKYHYDIADYLLSKGANINARDNENQTLMHIICDNNYCKCELLEYLISHGANKDLKDIYGQTPLHLACFSGTFQMVECLVSQGAKKQLKNNRGQTPLHLACLSGDLDKVKYLISRDCYIEAEDNCGYRPIEYAMETSKLSVIEYLISENASLTNLMKPLTEVKDENGRNVLHLACLNNNLPAIERILSLNLIDKETRDNYGNTPLHLACLGNNITAIEYLLINGTNKEAKNNKGQTPLHFAIKYSNPSVVDFLLSIGVDIKAKNNKGQTPLHLACKKGYLPRPDYFISFNNDGYVVECTDNVGQESCVFGGNLDLIKSLLQHGADMEEKDNTNSTPLHYACKYSTLPIIKYLISEGANTKAINSSSLTPVMCTTNKERENDIMKFLIEYNQEKSNHMTDATEDFKTEKQISKT